jgi:hypothetical protein
MSASGALRHTILRSTFLHAHAAGKFAEPCCAAEAKAAAAELAQRWQRAEGSVKKIFVFRTEIQYIMTTECQRHAHTALLGELGECFEARRLELLLRYSS